VSGRYKYASRQALLNQLTEGKDLYVPVTPAPAATGIASSSTRVCGCSTNPAPGWQEGERPAYRSLADAVAAARFG